MTQSQRQPGASKPVAVLLLVLLALTARVAWAVWLQGAIQQEGAYYARLAENLAAGRGYLGMRENGLQLIYPPLYPLLTAAVSLVVRHGELAGRIVSVVAGSLMVVPVWWIGRTVHSPRAGLAAGAMVALHPMLVGISAGVYSDALFLTLAVTGVALTIRCLDGGRVRTAAYAGVAFTLAYLTRPEGLGFPVLLSGVLLLRPGTPLRLRVRKVAAMAGAVVLVALPYVIFLWHATGSFRLETKSADNLAQTQAQQSGLPQPQAFWGLDPDLTERGINLRSNLDIIQNTHADTGALISNLIRGARINWPRVVKGLSEHLSTGALPFVAMAFLGLFATPWPERRFWHEAALFASIGVFLVALTTLQVFWERYLIPFMPFMAIWVGAGLVALGTWAAGTAENAVGKRTSRVGGLGAPGLAFIAILTLAMRAAPHILELSPGNAFHARVGRELGAEVPRHSAFMSIDALVPFYAGAVQIPFPYAASETALRYVALKHPDYLVLSPQHPVPYMRAWVQEGVPDARAHFMRQWVSGRDTVVVYRWDGGDAGRDSIPGGNGTGS